MTKTALVFPGQGSQTTGMLAELAQTYPLLIDTFTEVSDRLGYDLWRLVQDGPEEKLNQTEHTQAIMLTADVALFRVLQKKTRIKAAFMAGHSLGEYAALVCADALSLTQAADLVAARGRIMQQAIPIGKGAMAAIVGLTDEQVNTICVATSAEEDQVTPANYNAIGQVVIAGHTTAVLRAISAAEQAGARLAKVIPVSVPCHCPLLIDASQIFAGYLAAVTFKTPSLPVISNVDLSVYKAPEQIRLLLAEQLYKPVRWVETIQLFKANGVEKIIECGPGKILSGLIKRIDATMEPINTAGVLND